MRSTYIKRLKRRTIQLPNNRVTCVSLLEDVGLIINLLRWLELEHHRDMEFDSGKHEFGTVLVM